MSSALQKSLPRLAKQSRIVYFSSQPMPKNLEELNESHMGRSDLQRIFDTCSRTQEVAVAQSSRIFSSKFCSDQTSITSDFSDGKGTSLNDVRLMAYDMSNINIQMKTNVPEPYKAETLADNLPGLPSGLSDAKVNLEARSNMDCRLDLNLQMNDTYNMI